MDNISQKLYKETDKKLVDSITSIIEDSLGDKCTTETFFDMLGKCLMGLTIQWAVNFDKPIRSKAFDLYVDQIKRELLKLEGK